MSYTARNAVLKNTIVWQWVVIGVALVWAVMATLGWKEAPEKLRVNIAPKLPNEALVLGVFDADHAAVWQFAQFTLSIVNTWPENGEEEYIYRIKALKKIGFITNVFYQQLEADYQKRSGKLGGVNTLRGVTRHDSTPLEHSYKTSDVEPVKVKGKIVQGQWYAWIVLDRKETINSRVINNKRYRYKVRIKRTFENIDSNDYGLSIDAFVEQPQELTKS